MSRRIFKTCATLLAITMMGCEPPGARLRRQGRALNKNRSSLSKSPCGRKGWPALAETWLHTIHIL